MNIPAVAVLSLWRNDAERDIAKRVVHLLDKSHPRLRYLWAVGDSTDATEDILRDVTANDPRVTIVRNDTGIEGDDSATRMIRLTQTARAIYDLVGPQDDLICLHESDLISPVNVIQRLIACPGDVKAGWVTLGELFYDTYAYRKDGVKFSNHPPYHACYRSDAPFEVDCVGSVWMAPAKEFYGENAIRGTTGGVIDVMHQLKERGYRVFVDPTLPIVQPVSLWKSYAHADI